MFNLQQTNLSYLFYVSCVRLKRFALLLALWSLVATWAFAQTDRASIRGVIADAAKKSVPGATVKLINDATNEVHTTVSGADGEFLLALLPIGTYTIEFEAKGYKKQNQRTELQVDQHLRLDVSLEVGNISEEINVTLITGDLKKESASLGAVIDNRQVIGLPLDGRNFLDLSLLVPGAVPSPNGSAGSVRGDFAFNVNGAREGANVFLLDGAYNVDPKLNGFGVRPPVDAIQEFEVLTSTYDASFGVNPGAQVNIVLKTGTNILHGSAYEFLRNGATDARNFFAPGSERHHNISEINLAIRWALRFEKTIRLSFLITKAAAFRKALHK